MIFRKSKKTVKKSMWNMDKIITWIIVGWAAASIFSLSRTKKGKKVSKSVLETWSNYGKKAVTIFGELMVKSISAFKKK